MNRAVVNRAVVNRAVVNRAVVNGIHGVEPNVSSYALLWAMLGLGRASPSKQHCPGQAGRGQARGPGQGPVIKPMYELHVSGGPIIKLLSDHPTRNMGRTSLIQKLHGSWPICVSNNTLYETLT